MQNKILFSKQAIMYLFTVPLVSLKWTIEITSEQSENQRGYWGSFMKAPGEFIDVLSEISL